MRSLGLSNAFVQLLTKLVQFRQHIFCFRWWNMQFNGTLALSTIIAFLCIFFRLCLKLINNSFEGSKYHFKTTVSEMALITLLQFFNGNFKSYIRDGGIFITVYWLSDLVNEDCNSCVGVRFEKQYNIIIIEYCKIVISPYKVSAYRLQTQLLFVSFQLKM